jgi:endothelin-converting enzyme/putative endopeptidase
MRTFNNPFRAALLVTLPVLASAGDPPAKVPGFDPTALDRSAAACTDFYQFACGGWLARSPVPPDRARWGRFDELAERNQTALRSILDKASANDAKREAIDQKIGDQYAACMDEAAIEARGIAPLQADLDRIARLGSKAALPGELARLHAGGVNAAFRYGSVPDFKDADSVIAGTDQGGLGLPDRDYYLKDDAKSADLRAKYLAHVQKMLELSGEPAAAAALDTRAVMDLETALARASLERVKRRDPANLYHKMKVAELQALTPGFDWKAYLAAAGGPPVTELNVTVPDFFKALNTQLESAPLDVWRAYLRWHLLHENAGLLPAAFVNEDFAFYGNTLTGAKELRPRWKRCVALVDSELGEALGRRYVEATFGEAGKERTSRMVAALEVALQRDIETLPWMTEATKAQALGKLRAVANKIGYPDRWRDYSSLRIARGDALGNELRAEAFEVRRDLGKIGTRLDRSEWSMSPPTVNAYYSPLQNNINFPAGILQPPFYDNDMDDAVNFGGIGAVIGHELTHGFDDSGRKFAANGNLADWWTEEDGKEFEKRAGCIADQYSGYTVAGDVHLNGKLTLGENTADNGGLRIAYMALMQTLADAEGRGGPGGPEGPPGSKSERGFTPRERKDGFTPEQRLFLGWGQIWCQNETEESARLRATIDPHSPGRYRVNGVVSNMPEFQQAFGCKAGDAMVRENACRVW